MSFVGNELAQRARGHKRDVAASLRAGVGVVGVHLVQVDAVETQIQDSIQVALWRAIDDGLPVGGGLGRG